jgi:hypothetical protein
MKGYSWAMATGVVLYDPANPPLSRPAGIFCHHLPAFALHFLAPVIVRGGTMHDPGSSVPRPNLVGTCLHCASISAYTFDRPPVVGMV